MFGSDNALENFQVINGVPTVEVKGNKSYILPQVRKS